MRLSILLAALVMTASRCAVTPEKLAEALNQNSEAQFSESAVLPVYVATNRAAGPQAGCRNDYFTVRAGDAMRYAICETNVPKKHSIGAIDETEDAPPDRDSFFFAPTMRKTDMEGIAAAAHAAPQTLVFVHGFNVKFEEAVFRAAQMKYDLRFRGPVILFTWPAGSEDGLLSGLNMSGTYDANFANARKSRAFFRDFIQTLSATGTQVHLIVHSMGHQVVIPALTDGPAPRLGEVIFNAPDFAVTEFQKAAPLLSPSAKRITLYCSPGDNALVASEKVNGGKRIGRCAKIPGVDVINVNEVDAPVMGIGGLGHGYYSGRAILTDVYQVLLGVDVSRRLFVRRSGEYGGEDYVLRR